MNWKRWLAIGIAVVLFIGSSILNFATSVFFGESGSALESWLDEGDKEFEETVIEEGNTNQKIVVLKLEGVIQDTGSAGGILQAEGYNHKKFMKQLEQVKNDNTVKGIILYVNSPGGGVMESAQIHDKIIEIQEETGKKIYVSMGATAASGGYYVSAPADKIFASPDTLTGSLGVIMQAWNFEGLADKYGVDLVTIKSGPFKDIMSPVREVTEEERDILESMVDNSYNQFVKVIAEGRNLSQSRVRELADGRIYDGWQAKDVQLIDEFGYLEDTIDHLKNDLKMKNAQVIEYSSSNSLKTLFEMRMQSWFSGDQEMTSLVRLMSEFQAPRLMYLYTH
ncbi:signal peptide peptidase SppA [Bacillus carboniphilus]